jgi:predicted nuclease of predicted toxin-antitoxin system
VKLLLDAMYSPERAVQLRRRGHDVVAARAFSDLEAASDVELLAVAQLEERVVVTENVPDILRLDAQCSL